MHQKAMAVVKVNQNILGPALETNDAPALQPGGETGGKGKRRPALRSSTPAKERPTRTGLNPRITVSTSGSSGMIVKQ